MDKRATPDKRGKPRRDAAPPMSTKDAKKNMETMVELYLERNRLVTTETEKIASELEVRFGTNRRLGRPVSRSDYDNVVRQLIAAGFTSENPAGIHYLRVSHEYVNEKDGTTRTSNMRLEVPGLDLIHEYCRANSVQKLLDLTATVSATADKIKFTRKTYPNVSPTPESEFVALSPVDFADFGFRVSYQLEEEFDPRAPVARKIIGDWSEVRKTFRLMNRVRFVHPDHPVVADISILKTSRSTNGVSIAQYTIQEAGVLDAPESYEVELELDNSRVGMGTDFNTAPTILAAMRKAIRVVLGGIQRTPYPIPYSERDATLREYMEMVFDQPDRRCAPSNFIGPSPCTLQMRNVSPSTTSSGAPNVRADYTVSEKADGERRMLFVRGDGRVYMLDSAMNVMFTGAKTEDVKLHSSLLDGEFVRRDRRGDVINLFAAFDVYYINKQSTREFSFIPSATDELKARTRLPLLVEFTGKLKLRSATDESGATAVASKGPCGFRVRSKTFYAGTDNQTIFDACAKILADSDAGLFEYTTDGIIFTPAYTGVGSDKPGSAGAKTKATWERAFKWKPPQYNTIDFLVTVKKDAKGVDEIHNMFVAGVAMGEAQSVVQYKTLVLRCGFDSRKHRFMTPFLDMVNDNVPTSGYADNEATYLPVPFIPSSPYDENAMYCNVALRTGGNGKMVMMSEEGEVFEENTIVEFSYALDDPARAGFWRWIPLRVRYDKTSELRAGLKNFGNAYHVANDNWTSIHAPITREMICSGEGIPESAEEDDVYYAGESDTATRGLRHFHNKYVKRKLILGVSQRGDTLIDYSVGKAGDLDKWIRAGVKFVLGIDVARDNIHNGVNGACARYLEMRKTDRSGLRALFVVGDSGANIRSGAAFETTTPKDREVARAVFGEGRKDRDALGEGVYAQFGAAKAGFQVSSIQFSLHYFFKSRGVLTQFLRNVSECTKVGGYFVGTCYDGDAVFALLRRKNEGESVAFVRDNKKVFEITKRYAQTAFPENEHSVGYAVDVYQDSINKTFREYLVSFVYLTRLLEDFGFVLVSDAEATGMGLPSGSAMFSELFERMEDEVRAKPSSAVEYGDSLRMTPEDKMISFLNRYFVFRKERSVDTESMEKVLSPTRTAEEARAKPDSKNTEETKKGDDPEPEPEPEPESAPKKPAAKKLRVPRLTIKASPKRP